MTINYKSKKQGFWKNLKHFLWMLLSFLSPLLFPFLFLLLFILSFALLFSTGKNVDIEKYNNTIAISQDEAKTLGIALDEEGRIIECSNLNDFKEVVFTSPLSSYIDTIKNDTKSSKILSQACLYNILFLKYVNGEFSTEIQSQELTKINSDLFSAGSSGATLLHINALKKKQDELKKQIDTKTSILGKLNFQNISTSYFQQYKADEYGFMRRFNFPQRFFNENKGVLTNMIYNYRIAQLYSSQLDATDMEIFGLSGTGGNLLTELGDIKKDTEEFNNFFVQSEKWNVLKGVNGESKYYYFNCPPCHEKCSCTGDPEYDYGADFIQDKMGEKLLNKYLAFVNDLFSKNVIYVSEQVKSPFRNYTKDGTDCLVNIALTQRDGPSNLRFRGFSGYPKVNGIPTHAGLDIVGRSNCDGDTPPVFPVLDGEVFDVSYNLGAWGHTIVIKSFISGVPYYVRYSHLSANPLFSIGDMVSVNDIIGFQGDSGPSTGKHLDLTIYTDSNLKYSTYFRNTLELGGLYSFSFSDVMKPGYSTEYGVHSFVSSCTNCVK